MTFVRVHICNSLSFSRENKKARLRGLLLGLLFGLDIVAGIPNNDLAVLEVVVVVEVLLDLVRALGEQSLYARDGVLVVVGHGLVPVLVKPVEVLDGSPNGVRILAAALMEVDVLAALQNGNDLVALHFEPLSIFNLTILIIVIAGLIAIGFGKIVYSILRTMFN